MKENKHIHARVDKGKLWVHANGRIHRIDLNAASSAGAGGGSEEAKELIAPMNCKVVKLHVKAGDVLKKGDPALSVEAMKMEYAYTSPRDGKIKSVDVVEGQIVVEGTVFVHWEKT